MTCIGERIFHSFDVHVCIICLRPFSAKMFSFCSDMAFDQSQPSSCPFPVRIIAAFYHLMTTWLGLGSALEPRQNLDQNPRHVQCRAGLAAAELELQLEDERCSSLSHLRSGAVESSRQLHPPGRHGAARTREGSDGHMERHGSPSPFTPIGLLGALSR